MNDSSSININARLLSSLAEHLTTSTSTFISDIGGINNFKISILPHSSTNAFILFATGDKYHFESNVYCYEHSFSFMRELNSHFALSSIETIVDCVPIELISALEDVISIASKNYINSIVNPPNRAIYLTVENWKLYAQPSLTRDLERAALLEESSDTNIKLSMKAL